MVYKMYQRHKSMGGRCKLRSSRCLGDGCAGPLRPFLSDFFRSGKGKGIWARRSPLRRRNRCKTLKG